MERLDFANKRIMLIFAGLFITGMITCMIPVSVIILHHIPAFAYITTVYPSEQVEVPIGNAMSTEFTDREAEVLKELVTGASNREIAAKLNMGESTVKMHITNMLQKSGFHSRLELALMARHYGIAINEKDL